MVYSIPRWIKIGWFSPWAFVDYAIAALTKGSYYHLWYLWGMLCTIPLFYAVLRWFGKKTQYVLTAVLWLLEVSITAYSGWLPDPLCAVHPVLQKVERIICLLPLLLAGALIHDVPRASGKQRFVGFIISFALLFAESLVLRHSGLNAVSYAVFTLPTAYFLFQELLCVSFASDNVLLNKLSKINLFIYCVHPMLVELLAKLRLNSIIHFFLVAISSTALGYLYIKIANKRT